MRDLQGYRQYIYEYLDLESLDMSEALIDSWVKDGYQQIIDVIRRWPFFEMEATIATETGVRSYALPGTMVDVRSVEAPWGVLEYIDYHIARDKYHLYSGVVSTGHARSYSIWAGELQVWPMPDAGETLTVMGYREPTDWSTGGAGSIPDFPASFEHCLMDYVLWKAHLHQDDVELAEYAKRSYEEKLSIQVRQQVTLPSSYPLVMGGSGGNRSYLPRRLAYPWE